MPIIPACGRQKQKIKNSRPRIDGVAQVVDLLLVSMKPEFKPQ
jgi:hypothetical protein